MYKQCESYPSKEEKIRVEQQGTVNAVSESESDSISPDNSNQPEENADAILLLLDPFSFHDADNGYEMASIGADAIVDMAGSPRKTYMEFRQLKPEASLISICQFVRFTSFLLIVVQSILLPVFLFRLKYRLAAGIAKWNLILLMLSIASIFPDP